MIQLLNRASRLSVWIAGGGLLACAVAIGVEVVLRKLFRISLGGVDEISAYVFAIGMAWSLAFTLLQRAHIRIDLLYEHLAPRTRILADVFALVCLLAVSVVLLDQAVRTALTSWSYGTRSNTPLGVRIWVPQLFWAAGFGFFVLCQAALLATVLRLWAAGRGCEIGALTGIRSLAEETGEHRTGGAG